MIKLDKLCKSFGHKEVLHSISLQIDQPVVYGLIGPNGAGKTTLMRSICGILPASSGKIIYEDGRSVQDIAYMPDQTGLYTDMSVADEVKYIGQLRGLTPKEAMERASCNIKRLGLSKHIKTPIAALSKGTARKVQFVCTFLIQPFLAILDEPFSGLDPISAIEMEKIILEKKEEGVTILLSTHHMEHAERFCDHIFMINKGNLIIDDELEHLKLTHLMPEYQIESQTPLLFDERHLIVKEKTADIYIYVVKTDNAYTYKQMMKDIDDTEILSLNHKIPDLKEIFINSVKCS
ncbi:ATP-binding cassette domain-containing protein [Phocaeicola coprophilus]|uniref:ABC transporter ATP-binding protein n=1 Tax=Phocaeicola coprophilus TaxID=387090 RepID=UPI00255CE2D3|nr:ATP-binding cassette domain-containing protein [Phocaeicola coprophilus]